MRCAFVAIPRMADAAIKRQINDITECPICTEVYSDSNVLPCIHAFCLKCLEKWGNDEHSGDQVSCPLCRKEFSVPAGGFQNLPKNLFVTKLLEMKIPTNGADVNNCCDMCVGVKGSKECADVYCINCQQYLCSFCENFHRKLKCSRSHRVVPVDCKLSPRHLLRMSVSFCSHHPDDALRLYCFDCTATICMMCFVEVHKSHRCADVDKVAGSFRKQLNTDIRRASGCIDDILKSGEQLHKDRSDFVKHIATLEVGIKTKGEDLKHRIDKQVDTVLDELMFVKQETCKKMETAFEEIERALVMFQSFRQYCEELKDKETSGDISMLLKVCTFKQTNYKSTACQKSVWILSVVSISHLQMTHIYFLSIKI